MQQPALGRVLAIALLILVVLSNIVAAQVRPEPPPRIRLVGALLPFADKDPRRQNTLTVHIDGEKWIFRVVKVQQLTGNDPGGWGLLRLLFPFELRFLGPPELLARIQDPQLLGKRLILEGQLYTGGRRLFVTKVEEAAAQSQQPQAAQPAQPEELL